MQVDFQHGWTAPGQCSRREACPITAACGEDGRRPPCVDVRSAHDEKLRLCETLEVLADDLPSSLDRMKCLDVASVLVPLLRVSHRYEEEVLFPAFERGSADKAASAASVRRLRTEHVEDECAAQDITDALLAIGRGDPVENPEALGFMLRAFFETLRRHIAFEREHILPATAARRGD